MLLVISLILMLSTIAGWCLAPALKSPKALGRLAGAWLVVMPILLGVVLFAKPVGPQAWFEFDGGWTRPWISIPVLSLWVFLTPIRSLYHRAELAREWGMLLERSRPMEHQSWPELDYLKMADCIGVNAPPLLLSPDLENPFAIGILRRRILMPAALLPIAARGRDSYWAALGAEPTNNLEEVKSILAHELAHHRDYVGIRAVLMELGGWLVPWEFLTRKPYDYTRKAGRVRNCSPVMLMVCHLMTWISVQMAIISKIVWGGIVELERFRQEAVATADAELGCPGAQARLIKMGGVYLPEQSSWQRGVALGGLGLSVMVMAVGLILLPGRAAWPSLMGFDAAIPWRMPQGWTREDVFKSNPVRSIGYVPARHGRPPRVRVDNHPSSGKGVQVMVFSGELLLDEFPSLPSRDVQLVWPLSWNHPGPPPVESISYLLEERPIKVDRTMINVGANPDHVVFVGGQWYLLAPWTMPNMSSAGHPVLVIRLAMKKPGVYDLEPPWLEVVPKATGDERPRETKK